MNPKSKIQKGKNLEEWVAQQIREKGLDPRANRSHGSGNTNREKADIWTSMQILGQNAGIECKHQTNISFMDWWRQTTKLQDLSCEPVLVIKHTHDQYENTKAVIYLDTLLELLVKIEKLEK